MIAIKEIEKKDKMYFIIYELEKIVYSYCGDADAVLQDLFKMNTQYDANKKNEQ